MIKCYHNEEGHKGSVTGCDATVESIGRNPQIITLVSTCWVVIVLGMEVMAVAQAGGAIFSILDHVVHIKSVSDYMNVVTKKQQVL